MHLSACLCEAIDMDLYEFKVFLVQCSWLDSLFSLGRLIHSPESTPYGKQQQILLMDRLAYTGIIIQFYSVTNWSFCLNEPASAFVCFVISNILLNFALNNSFCCLFCFLTENVKLLL